MSDGSAAMAINPARVNPFSNYSNVALADAMGDLDVVAKTTASRLKAAKEEMDRRQAAAIEGSRFVVTKATEDERRLDTKALKAAYDPSWFDRFYKTSPRTTYTIRAKKPEQLGVAA